MQFANHRSPCARSVCKSLRREQLPAVYKNISARALFLHSRPFFCLCSAFSLFLSQTFTPLVIQSSCLTLNTDTGSQPPSSPPPQPPSSTEVINHGNCRWVFIFPSAPPIKAVTAQINPGKRIKLFVKKQVTFTQ